MAGKKKEGLLKDHIVPVRMTDVEVLTIDEVSKIMHELEPLRRLAPGRSEVIINLIKEGLSNFEAKYGKIKINYEPKREKIRKI